MLVDDVPGRAVVAEGILLGGRGRLVGGGVAELGDMGQVVEIHEGGSDPVVGARARREPT